MAFSRYRMTPSRIPWLNGARTVISDIWQMELTMLEKIVGSLKKLMMFS